MINLKNLMDYQKIAHNEELEKLISETHDRYPVGMIELQDDELDMVAAGRYIPKKNDE